MFDCLLPVLVWWLHPPPLHWDGDFNWIREHTALLRTAGLCLILVLEIYARRLRHFSLSCACWNNWKSKQSSSGSTGSSGVEGSLPSDRLNNVCLLIFYPNWEPGWHTSVVRANISQAGAGARTTEHARPETTRSAAGAAPALPPGLASDWLLTTERASHWSRGRGRDPASRYLPVSLRSWTLDSETGRKVKRAGLLRSPGW